MENIWKGKIFLQSGWFNHTNTKRKDKTCYFQVKKDEVKKLYEVYKNDFILFDYDPTEFIDIASSE